MMTEGSLIPNGKRGTGTVAWGGDRGRRYSQTYSVFSCDNSDSEFLTQESEQFLWR